MATSKKIKLLHDLPVEEIHGMKKNRELDVIRHNGRGFWVQGDNMEEVLVHPHECVVIEEDFI